MQFDRAALIVRIGQAAESLELLRCYLENHEADGTSETEDRSVASYLESAIESCDQAVHELAQGIADDAAEGRDDE